MPVRTILCVDDSPTELRLMQEALIGLGHTIITARDGEEALERVSQQKPDLILLDIILPKKNGFQVCRQLKTSPDMSDIKIILVSSKTQDTDRFWGLRQGADEYITKPFNQADLASTVARHLQ